MWGGGTEGTWTLLKAPCGRDKRYEDGKGFAAVRKADCNDNGMGGWRVYQPMPGEVEQPATVWRRMMDVPF